MIDTESLGEVTFSNGHYQINKRKVLELDGRQFQYCLGEAVLDNSCCGEINCSYALVEGERVEQKVLPIKDQATKEKVTRSLLNQEPIIVVNFHIAR